MLDRANAFRQHFDLDQERKYKELNLYVLQSPFFSFSFPDQSRIMLSNQENRNPCVFAISNSESSTN
jgi:hypothetical protein